MKLGTLVKIKNLSEADEKFKTLHQMGFSACQFVYKPKDYFPDDAKIIRKAADDNGIDISAQFCGFYDNETVWDNYYGFLTAGLNVEAYRAQRVEYACRCAEFVSALGITDMVIHAGYIPNNPFAPEYAVMVAAVECVAKKCKSLSINLLLETGGEAPIMMLRLIEDVNRDNIFINFDPANILMYGYGNPNDALTVFGKYVRNMHGKDGKLPTSPRLLGAETPVGEGMVDFKKALAQLKAFGYDRYIIIEREVLGKQQTDDIIKAKAYFENLL